MPLESRLSGVGSARFGVSSQRRAARSLDPHPVADERPRARRAQPTFPPVEQPEPSRVPTLPFRLRWVFVMIGAGLALRSVGLGAVAYWRLHTAATQFGNYAACMVGPTGPELLRDRPNEFWLLARRRLVASAVDARPFAPCVPALGAYAGSERRAAHEAKAADFREYAALRGETKPSFALADLEVTSARLGELSAAAWPFTPADLDALIRPERTAKVAPHPVQPAKPARGKGLPAAELGYSGLRASGSSYLLVAGQGANASAHRSDDGGLSWIETDVGEPAAAALEGLCSNGEGRSRFRLRHSGRELRVETWVDGNADTSFPVATADSRVLGFGCDASAAVAITWDDADGRPAFRICPERSPCRNLAVPQPLRSLPSEGVQLSIARIKGVDVIAITRGGVVRVISSRDDGATWTPPVVAFDRVEHGGNTPTHLLSLGAKLVLYAGSSSERESYASLASNDFGTSWQGL
ncbi:MAG TPA: hypothetical protein VMG12_00070 [Polyangiaceae bacterium]|nr:hypothetical protein [Polyangiaceae bacterium]